MNGLQRINQTMSGNEFSNQAFSRGKQMNQKTSNTMCN